MGGHLLGELWLEEQVEMVLAWGLPGQEEGAVVP